MSAPPNDNNGSGPSRPKAISNFAKRPSETTRQGTQKLKFAPTLPPRRKKEEVKTEVAADGVPPGTPSRDRGRGRGRGDGRGRGRGAARPPVEMTASGPFAMGPALAGGSARRIVPRSNFTSQAASTPGSSGPSSLSNTPAPALKQDVDKGKGKEKEEDDEVYSDPDEGVDIIDMENVRQMDWMAPESLKRERQQTKVKKEVIQEEGVDTSQALNLSESEDEEELEDLIEDFAVGADQDTDTSLTQDRLYFFQFPSPFPTYTEKSAVPSEPATAEAAETPKTPKKVSFSVSEESAPPPAGEVRLVTDGTIGHLEVYRSGAVKIRLANGIVLDVAAATQPSFLQQAVAVDMKEKKLSVLGEVNKRFVVSPDVDGLLAAMEQTELKPEAIDGEEGLISMDVS